MSHSEVNSITKIQICYSLWKNEVSPELIPAQLGVHRATVYRWIRGFQRKGIHLFLRAYSEAKKGRKQPRKTTTLAKVRILRIREEYKQCCGEKIRYILKKEYDMHVSVATIYRILGERYVLRSKWKKYSKRGVVRRGEKPREAIQTDTVDFGDLFAFTAIDTYTREVAVVIQDSLTSEAGRDSLQKQLNVFKHIDHIQRDGGPEFKDKWQAYATEHIPSIRTARPYKKNEQAFIERFNGILRKECLGYTKYKKKDKEQLQTRVNEYLTYYHTKRPHLSLHMLTPAEFALRAMSHLT
jgi:putative transposase